MKKTFKIDYHYGNMRDKQIKVHNCINKFDAKGKLHNYLVRKYGDGDLVVLNCDVDSILGMFNQIFNNE